MGTTKPETRSGLFELNLSPFVRAGPPTTWVQVRIPVGDPPVNGEGVPVLEYTAQASIVSEGFEAITSYVEGLPVYDPRKWVDVMDALASALPPGSYGSVAGAWFNLTFQSPATTPTTKSPRKKGTR